MLTIRRIDADQVRRVERDQLAEALADERGVVWIDLAASTPEENQVLEDLGLHPLAIDDLLDQSQQPKIEEYRDYLLLVVHAVDLEEAHLELSTRELDVVLSNGWVLTHTDIPVEAIAAVGDRIERNPSLATSAPRVLYEILDTMVEVYLPFLDLIDQRIDDIEEELFDRPSTDVRDEIYVLRRDVITLRRIAVPQAEAIRRLATRAEDNQVVTAAEARYFRDVHDQLLRVADLVDSYRDLLDGALDQYQSAVANAQNEIMKVLTMATAVLLPITVVAGIYGMNFVYMPELDEPWAYPVVWVVMIAIVIGVLALFRGRGWIGRQKRPRRRVVSELRLPAVGKVLSVPGVGARARQRRTTGRQR